MLLRKYFEGFVHRLRDQGARGEVHDRCRLERAERSLNSVNPSQIPLDKFRPGIDRPPMSFGQIIENADRVAFVEQELRANAADVACAADDKNFHRASCGAPVRSVKTNCADRPLSLFEPGDHSPNHAMFSSRRQDLKTLLF